MVKKIKTLSEFLLDVGKKNILVILVLMIGFLVQALFILILAKKWANEELRQEHTKWAQNRSCIKRNEIQD